MTDAALYERRLERERAARKAAERLLEEKSLEVYEANQKLKRSLERTERREALIKNVLDNVIDGVITLDRQGAIRVFSLSATRIFGVSAQEANGKPIAAFLPAFDIQHATSLFAGLVLRNEFNELSLGGFETSGVRADGEEFPVEAAATQFDFAETRTIVLSVRDLTRQKEEQAERQNLEGQLRHLQKMESLGTLAGGVAHEFNNMLVPIITLTEMSRDDLEEESQAHENLGHVLDAAARARSLIAKVLSFSRKKDANIEPVDIADVLADAGSLLRSTLPSTTTLDVAATQQEMTVLGDRTELGQILMNLVGNASAALDGCEGTVRVRADVVDVKIGSRFYRLGAKSDHYVRVVVADTGSGMDEKTVARIFDPFFTTKAVGQGTGLGLSVVHAIVERSRGLIDVTSTVGQGTEFTILLPVLDQTDETERLKSA